LDICPVLTWLGSPAAIFMVLSTVLQTTSPEVTKGLLRSITESYVYAKASLEERAALGPAPKVGTGIGYAVGLFVMQEAASLFRASLSFVVLSFLSLLQA
jgi:ATP-binding cassette, subfamily C (CFTR/MRP), member 1